MRVCMCIYTYICKSERIYTLQRKQVVSNKMSFVILDREYE